MKKLFYCFFVLWFCSVAGAACLWAEAPPVAIPYKPDPPIVVDGNLSDWEGVPGSLVLKQKAQVVWGSGAWDSPEDLSGELKLAWRREHLYLGARVADDELRQNQHGYSIWKGDHLELYLDAAPDLEPQRNLLGDGQFQFGFSPGNFQKSGDALADTSPEVWQFRPESSPVKGARIASMKTAAGWNLEVALPWRHLGIRTPEKGVFLRIEIAISDSDGIEPKQESMMTTDTRRWVHLRSRLRDAVLATADGTAPPLSKGVVLFDEVRMKNGQSQSFSFELPRRPEGRDTVLALKARLHMPKVAGFTAALQVSVNGTVLNGKRLLNKPAKATDRSGKVRSIGMGEILPTYYAPDFDSPDRHPYYALLGDLKACLFEFRINDLAREGKNELTVTNRARPIIKKVMVTGDARVAFRRPPPPPRPKAGPPKGPLPTLMPRLSRRVDYAARQEDQARLRVTIKGETYVVESLFSSPVPKWERGGNRYFRFQREVEQKGEAILVHDTFTNLTGANLGLMHRHQLALDARIKKVWLAGLEKPGRTGLSVEPANPITFVATASSGLGFLPLDDVSRIHTTNYATGGKVGLADNNLVLKPGETRTVDWAVLPVDAPDYWTFINAARRLVRANFNIPGGFAFLRSGPITDKWSDRLLNDFIRFKDPLYVCTSIGYPRYKGLVPHGTAFQKLPVDSYRKALQRWRRLQPDRKYLVYFHCFIDVREEAPELFQDSRTLALNGKQADYGKAYMRIFFPSQTNSYGREIGKNVDIILDKIGADGVYWDEHEYSAYRYHYGPPWDGVSGDIDARTMKILRLKSSVTLLSEKWRVALAKRIQARGPLMGNGPPITRAMASLHFPCFVETGSISNCARAQLYSPIALGDHLTERSELDAYHQMLAALDFGCLYHWYYDLAVIPTHPHLTSYMFPISVKEIHAGYVIGEDRIITRRSGTFGWGDASTHEVHVFNDQGKEVEDFKAPVVKKNGMTYTELRIGEDWSAAILRK